MCTFIMAQGVFQLYQVGIIIIIYFTDGNRGRNWLSNFPKIP